MCKEKSVAITITIVLCLWLALAAVGQNSVVAIGNARINLPGPGPDYVQVTPPVHVVFEGERDILTWNRPVLHSNVPESATVHTPVTDDDVPGTDFDKVYKRKANAIGFGKKDQFFSMPDAVAYSTVTRDPMIGPPIVHAAAILRVKQKLLFLYLGAPLPAVEYNGSLEYQEAVLSLTKYVQKTMQQWVEAILSANE
ncbi:MAG TPA: hypothetical protein VEH50_07345 [Methylomirabilota bacterium]|nr:hypothetical protein [Methylomirabilota bacterium]